MSEHFVVAYAKIQEDKEDGIYMQGVYFGGIGNSIQEAETIARQCVNEMRGGTIIPKIVKINGSQQVISALEDASAKFNQIVNQMVQAEAIINRSQARRR